MGTSESPLPACCHNRPRMQAECSGMFEHEKGQLQEFPKPASAKEDRVTSTARPSCGHALLPSTAKHRRFFIFVVTHHRPVHHWAGHHRAQGILER